MKELLEIVDELEQLHPSPFLIGEELEDGEPFEENLEDILSDEEWVDFNRSYYGTQI